MPTPRPNPAKYFAFLSYAHKDAQTAAALSRYIETFRVPVKLGGKEQKLPKRMYPIFRDRDEFSASSDLGAAIEEALAQSGALIVLCSPAAAQSKWVNEEILTFRRSGNRQRIFSVLLEGEPSESFPTALTEGEAEPLAVDFRPHQDNLRDARLRLVAALLSVDFDALKRRDALRVRSARLRVASLVAVMAAFAAGFLIHDAVQPKFSEFPTPTHSSGPRDITVGPDGALWFTENGARRIGRIAMERNGHPAISEYPTPTYGAPWGITAGPDGALWFTETSEIGRITIGRGGRPTISEYLLPTHESVPEEITAGRDGVLWFTDFASRIGRIVIGRDGHPSISEYRTPTDDSGPVGIAAGPDGAAWFTETTAGQIGRITIGRNGRSTISEYRTPTHDSGPGNITTRPDGVLWFTETNVDQIGRVTIGRDGRPTITEYATPTHGSKPYGIAAGPDGALWFTELTGQIGRIAIGRDGRPTISDYPIPTHASGPEDIAAGPDGALWFTESGNDRIGRVTTGLRLWK